ncbi:MAG: DNA helicase [Vicinamibacterales bacterium]
MELSHPIHVLKHRARRLARELGIPLHAALDQLAREQGFRTWGHLSARASRRSPARDLFAQLEPGDLILLGARPRQGKTVLSLELVIQAVKAGREAAFFTLEFTEPEVLAHLGANARAGRMVRQRVRIDTSDDISADHIIQQLAGAEPGTFVVVDYLQLLDQRRSHPTLTDQLAALRAFTRERGLITVCLSQIDREFERANRAVPTMADLRLPNPVDVGLFTKACFLHEGRMRLERPGSATRIRP